MYSNGNRWYASKEPSLKAAFLYFCQYCIILCKIKETGVMKMSVKFRAFARSMRNAFVDDRGASLKKFVNAQEITASSLYLFIQICLLNYWAIQSINEIYTWGHVSLICYLNSARFEAVCDLHNCVGKYHKYTDVSLRHILVSYFTPRGSKIVSYIVFISFSCSV